MKKCGIFVCAALATVFGARLNAAVESDIVGYTTITMKAGKWYAVGNPFHQLDGATTYKVMDVYGQGFSDGDMLYVLDPETSAFSTILQWQTIDGVSGWGDILFPFLSNIDIDAGTGVLIKKVTDGEISLSGRVEAVTSTIESQRWAYLVVQYPEKKKVSELTWEGFAEGDMLYIFDSDKNAFSTTLMWQTVNGVSGWGDTLFPFLDTTTEISIGQAFLVNKKSSGEGSVEF